jgi:hypothetical protein
MAQRRRRSDGVNCKGIFGRLFGHKYEPRYSRSAPTFQIKTMESLAFADELVAIMESSKVWTYHGDVCTRCGHVINWHSEEAETA